MWVAGKGLRSCFGKLMENVKKKKNTIFGMVKSDIQNNY